MDLTSGPQYDYIERGEYLRLLKIEEAAKRVLQGLNQRIEGAPDDAKPVFHGIAELHSALAQR